MAITINVEEFKSYRTALDQQFHVQMRTRAFGSNGM